MTPSSPGATQIQLVFVIEAEAGCYGPGSKLAGATNNAVFDLADIAQVNSDEVWMSAKVGEMNYNSSHE